MLTHNPFEKLGPTKPLKKEAKEKKSSFLNLLTDLEKAVWAIIDIESRWKDGNPLSSKEREAIRSKIASAASIISRQIEESKQGGLSEEEAIKTAHSGFEGLGGFNRYSVHGDGTICLSAAHSINECIETAKEWGVGINDPHNLEEWRKPCPCGSGEIYGHCHGQL